MSNLKQHMKAKCRASGGRTVYAGQGSGVIKEAKEKKGGGGIAGSKGKSRIGKARGGGCDAHPFSSAHRG
jgi:hypothetical protein